MKRGLVAAWLRLFSLQGSYNYERMQGVGAGVAAEPLLRDLPGGPAGARYRGALARAAHFFNAHPYLAGLAVGAAARAEHEGAPPDDVERLRTALCGPLGSVGDRLVWAGWLPLLAAAALVALALDAGWWAVVAFLVAYNVLHLGLRWWALSAGWRHGIRVASALKHPTLQRALQAARPLAALVLGFALPLAAATLLRGVPGAARPWAGVVAAAAFVAARSRLLRLTSLGIGLLGIAAALVAGWVWP